MRAILIGPEARTIEEIETKGDLDSMMAILKDGPCSVRLSQSDILWVGDNGLLSPGNAIFYIGKYPHPLAGPGLIIGIDETGENVPAIISLQHVREAVQWTDKETTGELTPHSEKIDGRGNHEFKLGTGILRDRK